MDWRFGLMIYGIGLDMVEVARIEESLQRFGERFQKRIFTEVERAYCNGLPHPPLHFAARFAAKEAFLKALGTGLSNAISWKDVGIENLPSGKPELRVIGRALELANERAITHMHVSLTHTNSHAAAVVVLDNAGVVDR
ncbi:MAG: holo-ACP synthase [Candidatus Sumerlaeaceae bacterium]